MDSFGIWSSIRGEADVELFKRSEMMGKGKQEVGERRKEAQRKASAAMFEEAAEGPEEASEEAAEESEASAVKAIESADPEAAAEEEEVEKEMEKWKEEERALDALRDQIHQEQMKSLNERNKAKEMNLNEKRSKKKKQKQRKKQMAAPKVEEPATTVQPATAVQPANEADEEERIQAEERSFLEHAKEARKMGEHRLAQYLEKRAKEVRLVPKEATTDPNAYQAGLFRKNWDKNFGEYGPFDKITSIPPSCFTDHSGDSYASMQETLLIFKVKVGEIKKPLEWPLDLFGLVAVRDVVDHNLNIIFHRKRDNCQTITKEDPYLTLTGPTRAVVASVHPTHIEVDLKVKGTTESEDKHLSYLVISSISGGPCHRAETSKLSTLELTYLRIDYSVEAVITVKVQTGSWPCGCGGLFTARSASFKGMEVVLLAFDGDKLPIDDDGSIKLSRQVVSVEFPPPAELFVSAKALCGNEEKNVCAVEGFTPKKGGRSQKKLEVGSCEMIVTVAWSLLSDFKSDYDRVQKERSDFVNRQ